MAKNGFRVMDSDLHTMEPDGLWERYLDEPFKRYAPRFVRPAEGAPNQPIIKIGDVEIAEMSKRGVPDCSTSRDLGPQMLIVAYCPVTSRIATPAGSWAPIHAPSRTPKPDPVTTRKRSGPAPRRWASMRPITKPLRG